MFLVSLSVSRCTVPKLLLTSERLGAAAAYTTVYAGDKRSFSHCLFCGATAAVAPNRQLCVRHFFSYVHGKCILLSRETQVANQLSDFLF